MKTEFFLKPGDLIGYYESYTDTEYVGVYVGPSTKWNNWSFVCNISFVLWPDIGLTKFDVSDLDQGKSLTRKNHFFFLGSFI